LKGNGVTKKQNHPSHHDQLVRLKKIKGQLEGIERMIEDRRYCPDIITQLRASASALKSLESAVLETHLHGCVKAAFSSKSSSVLDSKIQEILDLVR
jgi:DNA-binding FrmR family transcriptional regulator